MLDLFGTAYLGLQRHDEYIAIVVEGMRRYGVSNPFSRDSGYDFAPLMQAEAVVAEEFAQDDACLFSSGFLAGNAASRLLASVAIDENIPMAVACDIHPCSRLSLAYGPSHGDDAMACSLSSRNRRWIAMFEPLNSLLGTCSVDLHTSTVIDNAAIRAVDVSHTAFLWSHTPLAKSGAGETLFYGSLAKAAAFPAGFVAGPRRLIDAVRQDPAYRTSCPPANALANAFVRADGLRHERREKLRRLIATVDAAFSVDRGAAWFPAYYLGNSEAMYGSFLSDGVRLSGVRYPTEAAALMVRAVIHAELDEADVDCFLSHCSRKQIRPPMCQPLLTWRLAATQED